MNIIEFWKPNPKKVEVEILPVQTAVRWLGAKVHLRMRHVRGSFLPHTPPQYYASKRFVSSDKLLSRICTCVDCGSVEDGGKKGEVD